MVSDVSVFKGGIDRSVISIKMELQVMLADDVTKRERVNSEEDGTMDRALGHHRREVGMTTGHP